MNSYLKHWPQIVTVLLVAVIGSIVSFLGLKSDKYKSRTLSVYQPPSWVFSVVWTFIYITYWYVWQSLVDKIPFYLNVLFYVNMGLNLLWTVLFFGFFMYNLSFIVIIALIITLLAQVVILFRLKIKESGLHLFLLLIYLSWLCVATVLNYNFVNF